MTCSFEENEKINPGEICLLLMKDKTSPLCSQHGHTGPCGIAASEGLEKSSETKIAFLEKDGIKMLSLFSQSILFSKYIYLSSWYIFGHSHLQKENSNIRLHI